MEVFLTLLFFVGIPWLTIEAAKKGSQRRAAEREAAKEDKMKGQLPVVSPGVNSGLTLGQSDWLGIPRTTTLAPVQPETALAETMPSAAVDVLKHHTRGQFAQTAAQEFSNVAVQTLLTRPDVRRIDFVLKSSGGFKAKGKVRLK